MILFSLYMGMVLKVVLLQMEPEQLWFTIFKHHILQEFKYTITRYFCSFN